MFFGGSERPNWWFVDDDLLPGLIVRRARPGGTEVDDELALARPG